MKKLSFMLCILICIACKTRKVQTDITQTSELTDTEQTSQVRSVDTSRTIDKSSERSASLKQAENTSEGEIDSIVTKGTKTVIYPTKGKPFKYTGATNQSKTKSKQNDINTSVGKSLDSAGSFKQKTKQDSTHKAKIVDAKGSGTVWATYIGIGVGLALILAVFLYFRKK